MEKEKKENTGYTEEQMQDAKAFCGIINSVPGEKRDMFVAIANAYMDGVIAGEALAANAAAK